MAYVIVALSAFASWLGRYLISGAVLLVIGTLLSDVVLALIQQFGDLAVNAVNQTGITLPTLSAAVDALPPEMIMVMKRLHFDDCMSILVTAVGVRAVASMFGWMRGLRKGVPL